MSLLTFMEDPSIPTWYKKQKWDTAPQGAKNEYYYEKYARNPARRELGGLIDRGPLGLITGPTSEAQSYGRPIAKALAPEDLAGAGSFAGAVGGAAVGHPFLGAEAGGTLGGMAQGRSLGASAAAAAPPALLNWLVPKAVRTFFASRIAQEMSDRASNALGNSTAKLFSRLFTENPDIEVPVTPEDMENFYASGQASPAVQKTGEALGKFRDAIKRQPAFTQAKPISAPYKTIDPLTHTPRYGTIQMSLPEAIQYQQDLYSKGYALGGGPRGGIWAEPDRAIAAQMRQKILESMKTIPRSGPHLAQRYSDLSRDYGLAQTAKDVFEGATGDKGLLDHEKVYQNVADQKQLSHLNSLVGPQDTRGYLADIAPGRQRIATPGVGHLSVHPPGPVPARVGIGIPKVPTGPAAFTPQYPGLAGVIGSQAASQGIEKMSSGGE